VTEPDWTVAPLPLPPVFRQPTVGMPGTPPWRANQVAAATGVGWPPLSDTSDRANPDCAAQDEATAGTVAADRVALAPQADTASSQARTQPPDTAFGNLMLL
jgi:hypothetical protein